MKTRYVIAGAGGFGREVATWLGGLCAGFLDDTKSVMEHPSRYPPILGTIQDPPREVLEENLVVIAIGSPRAKAIVAAHLAGLGAQFGVVTHPSAWIVGTLSNGCIVGPFANVSADSEIGEHVIINGHCGIGHDVVVGKCSTLSSHVDLTGHVTVGKRCFFGSHASVLPGTSIGDDCTVGAGTVAARRLEPGHTLYPAPSRSMGRVE